MALAITTIATNIAAIDIDGVLIKDIDEIPESATVRDCPVMFPEPMDFVGDFVVEWDSFGTPTQAKKTAHYTLNYTFCYMPVGSGRAGLDRYGDMVEKAFAILDAIIANDDLTGTIEFEPIEALEFGAVLDPAGSYYMGCRFLFRITEFIN